MRGADLFDCVMPTRHARNGSLFLHPRALQISKNAPTIRRPELTIRTVDVILGGTIQRAYLRHLFMAERDVRILRFNTIHNLYYYLNLIKNIREAVKEDRFGV